MSLWSPYKRDVVQHSLIELHQLVELIRLFASCQATKLVCQWKAHYTTSGLVLSPNSPQSHKEIAVRLCLSILGSVICSDKSKSTLQAITETL